MSRRPSAFFHSALSMISDTISKTAFALTLLSLCPLVPIHAGQKEVAPPPAVIEEEEPLFSGLLSVTWDSLFICEGRNFIEEGGVISTFLLLNGPKGFGAWVWYGDSYETIYSEFDISLTYTLPIPDFDAGLGYTYLHFFDTDGHDYEANAWAYYRKNTWLIPGVQWKWGDFSNGSYLNFSLESEIPFLDGKLIVNPRVNLGLDYGYASREVDDFNNVEAKLIVSYNLTPTWSIGGYLAYSWALEDVESTNEGDQNWGGLTTTVFF
jgi:hypothetical protein